MWTVCITTRFVTGWCCLCNKKDMQDMKTGSSNNKVAANNRRVYHDYFIDETLEGGLVLLGTEVKSIRQGELSLQESYLQVIDGELFLLGMHIRPYEQGNRFNHDPLRPRKILLHKREINRLRSLVQEKSMTLVPTKLYFKNGKIKVEIGVARGKKLVDKREDLKKKDAERRMADALKQRSRAESSMV